MQCIPGMKVIVDYFNPTLGRRTQITLTGLQKSNRRIILQKFDSAWHVRHGTTPNIEHVKLNEIPLDQNPRILSTEEVICNDNEDDLNPTYKKFFGENFTPNVDKRFFNMRRGRNILRFLLEPTKAVFKTLKKRGAFLQLIFKTKTAYPGKNTLKSKLSVKSDQVSNYVSTMRLVEGQEFAIANSNDKKVVAWIFVNPDHSSIVSNVKFTVQYLKFGKILTTIRKGKKNYGIPKNVIGSLAIKDFKFKLVPGEKYDIVLRTKKTPSQLDRQTKLRNATMEVNLYPVGITPDEPIFQS